MDKRTMCETILAAKKAKGLKWAAISEVLGMSEVYVASCAHGENSMSRPLADKLCALLSLGEDVASALTEYPDKGHSLGQAIPTDPLVYRFYEIMQVYGTTLKDVIQEKFGDGIMSAIDFTMDIARESDPKGDRVVVTMNGKFLPYKAW
jgi:cyanate lyase